MKRIHIVGKKNHGKTTLTVALVSELDRRGVRVGTIKHSPHSHDLDTEGKDSYRHREAGGRPAAVVSMDQMGIFLRHADGDDPYAILEPMYANCDLVLVEGDKGLPEGLKLEVWRANLGSEPLCSDPDRADIVALITDDPVEVDLEVWPRDDVSSLADRVMGLLREHDAGQAR